MIQYMEVCDINKKDLCIKHAWVQSLPTQKYLDTWYPTTTLYINNKYWHASKEVSVSGTVVASVYNPHTQAILSS